MIRRFLKKTKKISSFFRQKSNQVFDSSFILESKKRLEKKRKTIQKELENFAKKDQKSSGDWNTRFPQWEGEGGEINLESAADEVEEYVTLMPIKDNLENRLKLIETALKKIKKGRYGLCERCGKTINKKRLTIYPEAKFCISCEKK